MNVSSSIDDRKLQTMVDLDMNICRKRYGISCFAYSDEI